MTSIDAPAVTVVDATDADRNRVVPLMRVLLVVGTFLVLAAAIQLYVLTEHTDTYFAWTIANPLTASMIGAFYIGAFVIAGASAWQRRWHMARVGVPGVLVFLVFTGLTTNIHHSTLHLHATGLTPRIAAIVWLILYIADPILLAIAFIWQLVVSRGIKPPRLAPLPTAYTRICSTFGVLVAVTGGGLFYGSPVSTHWPWPVSQIAAQSIAAWLIALGILLIDVATEADALRARPATAGMIVIALAQFGALARYPHIAHGAGAVAFIAVFAIVLVLGGYGLVKSRTAPKVADRA